MKDVQIHIVDFHDIDDMFMYTQTRLHQLFCIYTSKKLVVWFQPEMWICMWTRIRAAESSLLTNKAVSSAPQVWASSSFIMIKGGKHRGTYNTITICFPR